MRVGLAVICALRALATRAEAGGGATGGLALSGGPRSAHTEHRADKHDRPEPARRAFPAPQIQGVWVCPVEDWEKRPQRPRDRLESVDAEVRLPPAVDWPAGTGGKGHAGRPNERFDQFTDAVVVGARVSSKRRQRGGRPGVRSSGCGG